MKKSISLALSLLFLTHPLVFAVVPQELPRLTNQEVVEMLKAGLSAEGVISKIKASRCNFDTDPSILAELKYKGVSNDVLKAMIEAPYGPPRATVEPRQTIAEGTAAVGQEILVPDGTEFTVQTVEEISSKNCF